MAEGSRTIRPKPAAGLVTFPGLERGNRQNTQEAARLDTGDRSWIEGHVQELSRPAYQLAMMLVRDREIARDIVQEGFVRLWQSPRVPHDRDGFKTWLYRTITNLARDHHRRNARWAVLRFWVPPPADPVTETERRLNRDLVHDALLSLSEREREVISLRYFEDSTFDDVARILRIPNGACRVIAHRALKKLRQRIARDQSVAEAEAR